MDISLGDLSDYVNEYLSDTNFQYAFIIDSIGTVAIQSELGKRPMLPLN